MQAGGAESGAVTEAKDNDKDDAADKAKKLAKKNHEVEMARIDQVLARMKAEADLRNAREEVHQAEMALEEARLAKKVYVEDTWPRQRANTELSLDQGKGRADDSRAELEELEKMYEKEEFALSTKELVINRGRRSLEHTLRRLELQEAGAEAETTHEMPKKLRELDNAIRKAEMKLESVRASLARTEISTEQSKVKAQFRLHELQLELAELEEESEEHGEEHGGEHGDEGGAEG
jgi:hypothetical protein